MNQKLIQIDYLTKDIAKTFYEYFQDTSRFPKVYSKLMFGLNEEQVMFLHEIFARMIYIHFHDTVSLDIINAQEKEQQIWVKNELKTYLEEAENIIKYKNHVLPVNKRHFEISVFCYGLGINLLKNPEKIMNTDFIDIGAFIGDSALIMNSFNPHKIYAFEPIPGIFNYLIRTIILNKLENKVVGVQIPLADEVKEIEIALQGSGSSSMYIQEGTTIHKLKSTTLDKYVEENNLNVGLIKIDTEGADFDALRGSVETIKKFKPVLLLSIYHHAEHFFEMKSFIEELDLGYEFQFKKLNPFSVIFETMMICEVP